MWLKYLLVIFYPDIPRFNCYHPIVHKDLYPDKIQSKMEEFVKHVMREDTRKFNWYYCLDEDIPNFSIWDE